MGYQKRYEFIKDLKLSNTSEVLELEVRLQPARIHRQSGKQFEAGFYLNVNPVKKETRNGITTTSFMIGGGSKSTEEFLAPAPRWNAKQCALIARDLGDNGEKSIYGEAYKRAIDRCLQANNFILATNDEEVFQTPVFQIGETVLYVSDRTEEKEKVVISEIFEGGNYNGIRSDLSKVRYISASKQTGLSHLEKIDGTILSAERQKQLFDAVHQLEERQRAEAQEKADAEAKAKQDAFDEVKRLFPWAKQDGNNHARGASNIKTMLSQSFPATAFSVTSDSFTGGTSIRIDWTNGPTTREVSELTDPFQNSTFDPMQDLSIHRTDAYGSGFRLWMGSAKYVQVNRQMSDTVGEILREAVTDHFGDDQKLWRVFSDSRIDTEDLERIEKNDQGDVIAIFAKSSAPIPKAPEQNGDVTVSENERLGGIEIRFANKPDVNTICKLKTNGFRWSFKNRVWYAKASDFKRKFAYGLAGGAPTANGFDHFDAMVEDRMSEMAGVS